MMTVTKLRAAGNAELEAMVGCCVRDRNSAFAKLCEIYCETSPEIGRSLPTMLVRDILRDVCGYTINERALPKGQSALCDFRTRTIKLNSRPPYWMKNGEDFLVWQRSVLAHELGHIRLHTDEMENGCFISAGPGRGFDDPRFFQKEFEAELYAAIFLAPLELLEKSQAVLPGRHLLASSNEIWNFVAELARLFGTTTDLMRLALEVYGWVAFQPHRRYARTGELRLLPGTYASTAAGN